MFNSILAGATVATGSPPAEQSVRSDRGVVQYLFVRTVAFVALTSASTLLLALPHILQG